MNIRKRKKIEIQNGPLTIYNITFARHNSGHCKKNSYHDENSQVLFG